MNGNLMHADPISKIDFAALYRQQMAHANRREKPSSDWDARAPEMRQRVFRSAYVTEFLQRMDLTDCTTLLDIGCGPGTIALSLAPRLECVYGLDYSQGMLDAMMQQAGEDELTNVVPLCRSWEESWDDIPQCDIVVASRSTTVEDIGAALRKLHQKAGKRVYLTHPVGGHFIDPSLLEALGIKLPPLPDYIYLLNILYQMGIHPRLDYIQVANRFDGITDADDFSARIQGSLGMELNAAQHAALIQWFRAHMAGRGLRCAPMLWAFIAWEK
ncbi:class I SAM-dependent methyltransferase [Chrysiogenes arsenatis]|uniref:class I SAM-dependent methyltransferase n=1 Tax=Chrysiogenes arsenatis TaxID=309797 RepID=UPI001F429815|nr:class I SAM-dependent methyltransferase [Chrysiogenes arsenatis]